LVLSLSVALGIVMFSVVVDGVVTELESKVDVSVYFKPEASESEISEVRRSIERFPEVVDVAYTSRSEALAEFKQRHTGNEVILQALAELEENPLEARLAVRAVDASAYEAIAGFIEGRFGTLVSKVNYRENSEIIQRVFSVTSGIQSGGVMLGIVLFAISGLVAFNTIRLAIFSLRDEITVMRLVGASNWFIRGPFVIAGVIHGLVAAVLTFGLFYGVVRIVQEPIARFVPGVDLSAYYAANGMQLLMFVVGLGILTTIMSSAVAIRRYLRV
jgi:cell division transport system permease protein